mmetsp:Transcript_51359/g.123612  ORF Transcript_51359/g.123612 Transcript_51359/m.123612 type:complete len:243 (-) Transcript_51359:33-761(-)
MHQVVAASDGRVHVLEHAVREVRPHGGLPPHAHRVPSPRAGPGEGALPERQPAQRGCVRGAAPGQPQLVWIQPLRQPGRGGCQSHGHRGPDVLVQHRLQPRGPDLRGLHAGRQLGPEARDAAGPAGQLHLQRPLLCLLLLGAPGLPQSHVRGHCHLLLGQRVPGSHPGHGLRPLSQQRCPEGSQLHRNLHPPACGHPHRLHRWILHPGHGSDRLQGGLGHLPLHLRRRGRGVRSPASRDAGP